MISGRTRFPGPVEPGKHGPVIRPSSRHGSGLARFLALGVVFVWLAGWVRADLPPEFHSRPGGRTASVTLPAAGRPGFTLMPGASTRMTFTNLCAEARSLTNHILLNGSGVAAGDMDGDGRCDLYFCGLDGPNVLYRNRGNWQFEDITAAAGVACPGLDATGAVFADVDGDGHLDLLVSGIGQGVRLFHNDGHGRFTDITATAGLASTSASLTMTLADVDGDGALDLYVANYRTTTMRDAFRMQIRVGQVEGRPVIKQVNGRDVTEPDLVGRFGIDAAGNITENGEADAFYRNDGHGHFRLQSWTDGTFRDEDGQPLAHPPYDWSLTAMFRDLDGDGRPDLYVCGDLASPDRIWMNRGEGRFQAIRRTAIRKTSWFSMGVDAADLDRDGRDELFVTDMVSRDHRMRQVQVSDHQFVFSRVGVFDDRPATPRNTLFWNAGDGDYLEMAYAAGLDATEWSWSPVFLDVDLDGYEDVLVATGFERDVQDADIANQLETARQDQRLPDSEALRMRRMFPRLELPSLAFRNRGNLTFEEAGAAWHFDTVGVAQGVALADLDNDGDLDVIVNRMNGEAAVYRNESTAPRLAVRLRGQPPNTRGIGARIRVYDGAVPMQSQEMQCGGRYLSSDDALRVFAAGNPTNRLRLEVDWRSGRRSQLTDLAPNQIVEVVEPAEPGAAGPPPPAAAPVALFENRSPRLDHRHVDAPYDDFARQPLLPRKLSQLGPGLAWTDLNGDGHDDLAIGGGRGGRLALYLNDGAGGFRAVNSGIATNTLPRDLTGLITLPDAEGQPRLVVGMANYEDATTNGPAARVLNLQHPERDQILPGWGASVGPMAAADIDGDGDLDLFIGGRVIPGRYPEPASSRLFRQQQGQFVEDTAASRLLAQVGLVSGAVFTDLDGDGDPELVLACEWGPIRIYRNDHGNFQSWDPALVWPANLPATNGPATLSALTGWWNGIAAGDFDGDGRLDLIGCNWGTNTKYESHRTQPLRLYYGDFSQGGGVDLIEAYYDPPLAKVVPWLHLGRIGAALPSVRAHFATFREFASASVAEALGDQFGQARELQATWLETTLFLNRPDGFHVRPLPALVQWSPAFAACVADFDGDGHEDVFLSQNFFATEPETGRHDAGRGLLLLGDGAGGWRSSGSAESGIRIYGEQRAAAVGDYDEDGRPDLAVTQNGAATQLLHNVGGRPGLRVRLQGPAGNPYGIGAVVRAQFAGGLGPAREIHAGAGYWSQESPVTVLATPEPAVGVQVRWPGGRSSITPVPANARELTINRPPAP